MASEEVKKKWGTIFMGDREASVEQLKAMQEPLQREKRKKEDAEDYMERVRARAAERAREILGAAYAERQKVLEEARGEAAAQKKRILGDCDRLRAEAESARQMAKAELERAEKERKEAELQLKNAHDEGYKAGMERAGKDLHEFRLELGQALGQLLRALEWQQNEILKNWRDDLVTLVQCAAQAGAGYVLNKEHKDIMRALVFQALDLLESRKTISIRVNPEDEAQVGDLFRAARERFPELGQWIVTGDEKIEKGGLIAESGSGSVDLKRENFREMVNGVLTHLALPETETDARFEEMISEIVEREATRITSLTPEQDMPDFAPVESQPLPEAAGEAEDADYGLLEGELMEAGPSIAPEEAAQEELIESESLEEAYSVNPLEEEIFSDAAQMEEEPIQEAGGEEAPTSASSAGDPALAALEEELFPLDEDDGIEPGGEAAAAPLTVEQAINEQKELELEPETLAQGGFL